MTGLNGTERGAAADRLMGGGEVRVLGLGLGDRARVGPAGEGGRGGEMTLGLGRSGIWGEE